MMPNHTDAVNAVRQFMEDRREGRFNVDSLDVIIDTAISEDLLQAREGTGILFGQLIEPLSDTFLAQDRSTLQKVLAHVISRLRELDQAAPFHQQLQRWGLNDETSLLKRMDSLSSDKTFDSQAIGRVGKVFVPSRVTLGADVLLNSPVIEKMKKRFPGAEIVFLGSEKNGLLIKGSQSSVRVHAVGYSRRDILLNRFMVWLDVIRALESELNQLEEGEDYILVNTDSRLFQSGLLPALPPDPEEKRYFFWKPAINLETWKETSQAEDLLQWLDASFGPEPPGERIYPEIHFLPEDDAFAKKVSEILTPADKNFIVSMSLGVGGNREKRVKQNDETVSVFELNLIRKLLSDGVTLVLDKGNGREEFDQAEALMQAVGDLGFGIAQVSEEIEHPESPRIIYNETSSREIRLVVFQGSVRKFAALINISDLFIGYDSLGQHLAGALGCNVITVFSGYHSDLFPQRWKPLGRGIIRLVKGKFGPFSPARQQELVKEVFKLHRSMRKGK